MAKLFTPLSPETDGDIDALLSTMMGANGANDSNGSISNVEKCITFYCPHSLEKIVTNGDRYCRLSKIRCTEIGCTIVDNE